MQKLNLLCFQPPLSESAEAAQQQARMALYFAEKTQQTRQLLTRGRRTQTTYFSLITFLDDANLNSQNAKTIIATSPTIAISGIVMKPNNSNCLVEQDTDPVHGISSCAMTPK
jgi:transposase